MSFASDGTFINKLLSPSSGQYSSYTLGGRRGRDRMVVGFTTTYAISTFHH